MIKHRFQSGNKHRSAFTLIELLVVITLIIVLLALVLSGLNRATKSGRRTASQQSASALAKAVDQFKQEFGFLPPLVHDGEPLSNGDDKYRPDPLPSFDPSISPSEKDGPFIQVNGSFYTYNLLVVWNEGLDFNFFRRRTGSGSDAIDLPNGSGWSDDGAWDDRRYSKYSLAYYLAGVLGKETDGVRGPGMARPIIDGSFLGIGYPGGIREKYDPFMDVSRRGATIRPDYVDANEVAEHGGSVDPTDPPDYQSMISMFEDYQRGSLFAFVDGFGNAYRYYRWEPGRYENGRLVVENELDLNIPAVLIDPVEFEKVQNDPQNLSDPEVKFIGENSRLRDARYAIVSAGPDGYFGTESIETIAAFLRREVPGSSQEQAELRREVWADNLVEVGS
ncbi:MAG: prepilin-type N-terminal cleavage/methylation domain-containing protein [Phycisphaerales bacterium]|nr:prepilin-type N-terminal cleavage/methylation domain-containing protein [Phycisphaerales bacterium]